MQIVFRALLSGGLVVLLSCDAGNRTATNRGGVTAESDSLENSAFMPLRARDREAQRELSPNFIAGWQELGTCTPQDDMNGVNRDSVLKHLEIMRRHGVNTIRETASADGRIVARGAGRDWTNWYGYSYAGVEGLERRSGHPRPGVFVEGMRWLLDAAYGDADDSHIEVVVGLPRFVTPGYRGEPFGGSDVLSCDAYRDFIRTEMEKNSAPVRAQIPEVRCSLAPAQMPFWEWNVWYVVENLSDHPGLRAWYLWDEPEGIAFRHLFGVHQKAPPQFYGPESLPTTDLLRYVYWLVRKFDESDNPIIVDIHSPHVFFSERFEWSTKPDPDWSSGPFDLTPTGDFQTPADILGLEASAYIVHPQAIDGSDPHPWYWDTNHISRTSSMLAEAAMRDGKRAMVVAAQAQLPSGGAFAPSEPLRCEPNDATRTRILNDRDLKWQLLTTHINGLYGYVYYSHALMPSSGPGAVQVQRSNRLLEQFLDAGLDNVFARPDESERIRVGEIRIVELADYYRNPPANPGPPAKRESDRSNLSSAVTVPAADYRAGKFNRSPSDAHYGAPVADENPYVLAPKHRLFRTSLRRWSDAEYLFVSNAYDARITAALTLNSDLSASFTEGLFDLNSDGEFRWAAPTDIDWKPNRNELTLAIDLEPYEARLFKIE